MIAFSRRLSPIKTKTCGKRRGNASISWRRCGQLQQHTFTTPWMRPFGNKSTLIEERRRWQAPLQLLWPVGWSGQTLLLLQASATQLLLRQPQEGWDKAQAPPAPLSQRREQQLRGWRKKGENKKRQSLHREQIMLYISEMDRRKKGGNWIHIMLWKQTPRDS